MFNNVKGDDDIILNDESTTDVRCERALHLLLTFAERNPGITRILTGDPLAGETDRLRERVAKFFERFETQLKQILREAEIRQGPQPQMDVAHAANLMLAFSEGRLSQFVRSEFTRLPSDNWPEQWVVLRSAIFQE